MRHFSIRPTLRVRDADTQPSSHHQIKNREESTMDTAIVELDCRHSGAVDVSLLWHRDLGAVSLTIRDSQSGHSLELPVAHDRALQAFKHPFAYAASIGVDYATTLAVTPPPTAA
jgi:hypothetical protein